MKEDKTTQSDCERTVDCVCREQKSQGKYAIYTVVYIYFIDTDTWVKFSYLPKILSFSIPNSRFCASVFIQVLVRASVFQSYLTCLTIPKIAGKYVLREHPLWWRKGVVRRNSISLFSLSLYVIKHILSFSCCKKFTYEHALVVP